MISIKGPFGRPSPFGWLRRAFSARTRPMPSTGSGLAAYSLAPMGGGCKAGVIMSDGEIVRCEGEPPIAVGKPWFRPAGS